MTREEALTQVAKNLYFSLCLHIKPTPAICDEKIMAAAIENMIAQVIAENNDNQIDSEENNLAIQET